MMKCFHNCITTWLYGYQGNTVAGLLQVLLADQTYQLLIQFPLFEHIRGMIEELMFPL